MNKYKIISVYLLLFPFFQASAESSVMKSQKALCTISINFEEKACSSENFFKTDVSPKMEEINKNFQDTLDNAFHDNQAYPEFLVKETIKDFRVYHYCFEDLCDKVYENCAQNNANSRTFDEFKWCKNRQEKLEDLQKSKIHFIVSDNTERKHRSLLEEKINALAYKFNQFIHPKKREIKAALDKANGSIGEFLILYPRGG